MRGWILTAVAAVALAGCAMEDADTGDRSDPGGAGGSHGGLPPGGAPWHGGERYEHVGENPFVDTEEDPLATFGLDVDTASYSLMRRDLRSGFWPNRDGVRVEEFLNYFSYPYPEPADQVFSVEMEAAPSPFGEGLHLLRVGLKARSVEARGRANLVFLVDVSGSMAEPDKLPLVQRTLHLLLDQLRSDDRVALVVYAGAVGTVLEPTPASQRETIRSAIDRLAAGGSTNGEGGIRAAYELARRHYDPEGINRVILCTDGDFNMGLVGDPLIDLIEGQRRSGIYLTTLGFGRGNIDDATMEKLADRGNGNYAFIDGEGEAARVVQRDLLSTMVVVAEDARVQIEFDRRVVKRYRLIGYENRAIADDEFEEEVDSGDVGAGHDVTALLELELHPGAVESERDLAHLRLLYRVPGTFTDRRQELSLPAREVRASFAEASASTRFAAAVAEFAEILRESRYSEGRRFAEVRSIVAPLVGDDPDRAEFLELIDRAAELR